MESDDHHLEIRRYQDHQYVYLNLGENTKASFTFKAMEEGLYLMKTAGVMLGLMVRPVPLDNDMAMRTLKNAEKVLSILGRDAKFAILYATFGDMEHFAETVLLNRGLNVQIFIDETKALDWLISSDN